MTPPGTRPDLRKWMTPERGELGRRGAPPAIYPTSDDFTLARLNPSTGKDGVFYYDTAIGDGVAEKGFVYCDVMIGGAVFTAVTRRRIGPASPRIICRVDGVTIPTPDDLCRGPGWIAFERDEYAITAINAFKD